MRTACFIEDGETYYITDHLGNTRVTLTSNGNIISAKDYEPFGKELHSNGYDRLTFIGKEQDAESNLGDFGVRKYDAEYGRFLSVDRLWEKYRILNSYQYAGNNPMTLYDKGGEFIQAISKESQQSIRESVPEKFRGAIQFNEDGFLQINPLKKIAIGQDLNSNISILSRLAENEHTARVFVTDDFEVKSQESGNIEQTSFSNLDPGGRRLAGLTLFPEKDKWVADVSQRVPLSPNGITYILIRPEQPRGMTKGSTAAHELFSHFRYLLLSKLGKANGARHSLPGEEKNDVDRAGKRAELEADR